MVQKIGSRKDVDRKEKTNETVSKPLSISIGQQQQQQQRKRYMGVRRSPSGRWVAEIKGTAQKIRLWLGTFDTEEAAAHAYDEAACLLRGANTRTNFWPRKTGGFGGSGSSNSTGSSSVLSTKVLNHLLGHLETQRTAKISHYSTPPPSASPLFPHPPPPPQHQQQQHKHNQELQLIKRMAYGELSSDVSTSSATTHDEMKGKVERAVNLVDMDLRLEDFSCFFAPFEIEGRERVEIGAYEYWSMLSAAAKGV